MKKITVLLLCLFGFFSMPTLVAQAEFALTPVQKQDKIYQKTSENKNRIFFTVDLNEFRENQRSAFINQLYSSQILAVISRVNEKGFLQISCSKNITLNDVDKEINRISAEIMKISADAGIEKY
jgi:hypothetical protein